MKSLTSKTPITIDCQYLQTQIAAAYLIVDGEEAAFIENNTTHSVPLLLDALSQQGLRPENVKYLIVTHVHLDHAGGSSALMKACPHAKLLAHPRAAPHLIDPSKLIKSARQVYGDSTFDQLYGEIAPIDSHRVQIMQDQERIQFGSREFQFLHTRGHANHHFCVYDSGSKGIFTGDSFGLAYPKLQTHGLFIFPSTSPTDFDPLEARKGIQTILNSGAECAYLTHFGKVEDLPKAADQLLSHLDFAEDLLNQCSRLISSDTNYASLEQLTQVCRTQLSGYFEKNLLKFGIELNHETWQLLKLDLDLNAAGIAYTAYKKHMSKKI